MKAKVFFKSQRSGYTLFELVMVIILVGIMFMVTAPLMIEISRGWQIATVRTDMSESGMVAMDRMAREIRQVRDNKSVASTLLSCQANVCQDITFFGIDNIPITYNLSVPNLIRIRNGVSNTLATNVNALSFTYYKDNYTTASATFGPLGVTTDIKSIGISLTFGTGETAITIKSGIYPRRLQ